ncbi:sulfite exporter TauE/SafE family protein [Salibacter halophilus]|uniref:Sulfite exporter TauE/SafE family protein n=1 Tax=Salibacter halophilus TaxID=1803916 RepID=A0A6N6M974_9FLAO|nr:sulfite exporter TauE/SafE family protein [Salibacter halophilus]KAB1064716.1 sulfite exporter TauE/SafE family protein [Salibacter halophilus]
MIPYWTAISLGLISSLHCMGMCGPIAMAIPVKRQSKLQVATGAAIYNAGRISTYMILGLLFGLLGKTFFTAGVQRGVSIGLGIVFLLAVIIPRLTNAKIPLEKTAYKVVGRLMGRFKKLFKTHSAESVYSIGVLNGLLPCGMVYLALAGAISTGGWSEGAIYMLFFGMGTLPLMLSATMAGSLFSASVRTKFRKAIPVLIGVMGVLLILRGMNLGIPYVSPEIEFVNPAITECD